MSDQLATAVRGYLDHLAVERGLARNTVSAYRRDLDRYQRFLAGRGITDFAGTAEADVTAFLAELRTPDAEHRPLSAASASRAVIAVRGLHRFAAREGIAAADPAREVRPPAPPMRLPKALPVTDVIRLLDAAGAGEPPMSLRDRALLELLYGTGARISELVGADVDDLDLAEPGDGGQRPALLKVRGKGSKERVVPVGSYAKQALAAYLVRARPLLAVKGRGGPALLLNARGGRLTRQGAWQLIKAAADRAGLGAGAVSPHTLRHCFATHLLDGGADVRVVQELLGHASVTTTQIYTLVTVDKLREVYAAAHPRAR
ncbi:MAG: site-specific tyrosine recombinase XerD [Sporichthyaceae bacterium]|nr:site-specific tyrosine recombinase XerD [Sporichthyaceae bacterium]